MNTTKAIALGLISLLTAGGANAQVMKQKQAPQFYSDPKMKVKDVKDGTEIIKDKGYGGYFRNRQVYYDADRHLYYYVYNGKKIYYRKGWVPE